MRRSKSWPRQRPPSRRSSSASRNSVAAHTLLAVLVRDAGQRRPRRASGTRRVLKIDPDAAVAANNLAYSYAEDGRQSGRGAAACADCQAEAARDPRSHRHRGLGVLQEGTARPGHPDVRAGGRGRTRATRSTAITSGWRLLKNGERQKARAALELVVRRQSARRRRRRRRARRLPRCSETIGGDFSRRSRRQFVKFVHGLCGQLTRNR